MPDGDAFDLLNRIGKVEFEIIFNTAYNDFALKAFEFSVLHYLLKPINYTELQEAVQRFMKIRLVSNIQSRLDILNNSLKSHFDKISLPSNDGLIFVEIQDIVRFEAAGNYSTVFLSKGENIQVIQSTQQNTQSRIFSGFRQLFLVLLKQKMLESTKNSIDKKGESSPPSSFHYHPLGSARILRPRTLPASKLARYPFPSPWLIFFTFTGAKLSLIYG